MIDDAREVMMQLKSGMLAAFGGVVGYVVDVTHKGTPFSWASWSVYIVIAFFVGQVLESWLPSDMPGKGGVLMVAGTSAYPILVVLQTKVSNLIEKMQ